MTVIYALKDPRTDEVRYVGKARSLNARMRGHKWDMRNSTKQTPKVVWLQSLSALPIIEVLEIVPAELDWMERERYWIAKYRAAGADLVNVTDGGDSPLQAHSAGTKALLRELALARGARPPSQQGIKATAELRAKLSRLAKERGSTPPPMGGWNKGQTMSPEFVEKNRLSHPKGKPWTEARRAAQEARSPKVSPAERKARQRERTRLWRERNRERISAYNRKYNEAKKVG